MVIIELRAMAKQILQRAHFFEWSLQGLGMLRLHLSSNVRLHVWDLRHRFPGASPIHDHLQWGLHSTILSGHLKNRLFQEEPEVGSHAAPYLYQTMRAGYGCKALHEPRRIFLKAIQEGYYSVGEHYSQRPSQIHETLPDNGTVTIMRKTPAGDTESARVFWPMGEVWGSAEPRQATPIEVAEITQYALEKWTPIEGEA